MHFFKHEQFAYKFFNQNKAWLGTLRFSNDSIAVKCILDGYLEQVFTITKNGIVIYRKTITGFIVSSPELEIEKIRLTEKVLHATYT
jgi:hypothetical protein